MVFTSNVFLIFFIVFLPLYFIGKNARYQNALSLIASYVFYGWWDWRFLFLISGCILVTYGAAVFMSKFREHAKAFLAIGITINLVTLAFFKYFNFFTDSFIALFEGLQIHLNSVSLNIVLPVGISFFIFQAISYLIDVYREKLDKQYTLLTFATYISLFPQLVAGPIVRASTLLPQLSVIRVFSFQYFILGIEAFVVGMALKLVIADRLGILVDRIFQFPEIHSSLNLLLGTVFFAFQIYADFAGYSLMAIGVALIMGLKFRKNFNRPYFASSFSEFWGRWHISLSSWLRDYLYISLGGNRSGNLLTYRNLTITMLLGGLWHGASWNFVIWGALHGAYLSVERIIGANKVRKIARDSLLYQYIRRLNVFFFVCIAWIFFRTETFHDALVFFEHMLFNLDFRLSSLRNKVPLLISCCLILGLVIYESVMEDSIRFRKIARSKMLRLLKVCFLMYLILLLGSFGSNAFIYFQF